jgi:DNA-binding SARP family transcriptional activator/WD40 repeat protein
MALEFGVLGPVEVRVDGEVIALGGAQQRRVLAALVAERGRVVSVERLIDVVWPDVPPDGARHSVMTYVSRLRHVLGDGHIVTADTGYRLVISPDEVDAARFEQLHEQARGAPPTQLIAVIDHALDLWRGRAFGEFADEWWALPYATRLEELRIVAAEQRAEALIAIGDQSRSVVELEGLVDAYPLRERPVALLMRAHDASGRPSDAVRAFARYRERLAEETGLEPSAALRELEASILDRRAGARQHDGRQLRGYALGEVLGEGAFGTVFKSRQPGVGREVAVKVIRADLADDPDFVRHFEAEAQLVANLEHPHIVPLYDFWREPGGAYLVFRLLRGGSAEQRVRDEGPWPLDRVNRLVQEIGGALVVAHEAGVVHRDVKPANVLFDDAGNAYLADFGIAVVRGGVDGTTGHDYAASAGSPLYAPPEQFQLAAPSPRGDQYSFATMLWELLAGVVPFPGETASTILLAKLERPVPPLAAHRPDVPRDVDAVLRRATSSRPDARYDDIASFLAAWHAAVRASSATTGDLAAESPRSRTARDVLATVGVDTGAAVNPYKGLRPFGEADARHFHGREAAAEQLVERVLGERFVALVGPSGSGKSSLLHAGAVPRLRAVSLRVVAMLPGDDPVEQLHNALRAVAVHEPDTGDVANMVRSVAKQSDEPLVLVIDQFEELWTLTAERDRELLLAGLAGLVDDPAAIVHLVVSLRADFYDRPLAHAGLGAHVAANTLAVTPMTAAELHEAVVAPAADAGVVFEPGLDSALVAEVAEAPASLPMLQFTLAELFERRRGIVMTGEAYAAIGGIAGAIATRAEQQYARLDAAGQDAARRLFCRLVVVGDGTDDTRRRVRHSDLPSGTAEIAAPLEADRLLVADRDPTTREPTVELAHESLLRSWPRLRGWLDDDRDAIRQMHHLGNSATAWDAAGRPEAELYRGARLEAAGSLLDTRPEQLTTIECDFVEASRTAASAAREREARTRTRLRRGLTATAAALVVALVAGAIAVVQRGRADGQAAAARRAADNANTAQLVAIAGERQLSSRDQSLALLLAVQARHLQISDITDGALEDALAAVPPGRDRVVPLAPPGSSADLCWFAVSRDGRYAASLYANRVHLIDMRTGRSRTLPDVSGPSTCPYWFSADGNRLLTSALGTGKVIIWNTASARPIGVIPVQGGTNNYTLATETRPGRVVTSASTADGSVDVWDTSRPGTPRRVAHFNRPGTNNGWPRYIWLADDANPDRIAIGGITETDVWQISRHKLAYPPLPGVAVGESPDGKILITNDSRRHRYRFWDVASGRPRPPLFAGITPVDVSTTFPTPVWFSADGTRLEAVDGPTKTVRVIDVATRRVLLSIPISGSTGSDNFPGPFLYDGRLSVFDGPAISLWRIDRATVTPFAQAFGDLTGLNLTWASPDGAEVVSTTSSGLSTWDPQSGAPRTNPPGGPYTSALRPAFSPDGRLVASPSAHAAVVDIFDATSRVLVSSVPTGAPHAEVAWSPDERVLATATAIGDVGLWDITDPNQPTLLGRVKVDAFAADQTPFLVFSPDSKLVAVEGFSTVDPAATFSLIDVRARSLRPVTGESGYAIGLPTFSPDSRVVAVPEAGLSRISFWDAASGRPLPDLVLPFAPFSVAYVDGGRWLAIGEFVMPGTTPGGAQFGLWDARTLLPVGTPLRLPGDAGFAAVTHPGTSRLVTGSTNALGRPILWDFDPAHWEQTACRLAGRNLTRAEWAQYLPGRAYEVTCPQWPSG